MPAKFRSHDLDHLRALADAGYSLTETAAKTGWSRVTIWKKASLHGFGFQHGKKKNRLAAQIDPTDAIGSESAARLRREIARAIEDATNG